MCRTMTNAAGWTDNRKAAVANATNAQQAVNLMMADLDAEDDLPASVVLGAASVLAQAALVFATLDLADATRSAPVIAAAARGTGTAVYDIPRGRTMDDIRCDAVSPSGIRCSSAAHGDATMHRPINEFYPLLGPDDIRDADSGWATR